MNKVVESNQLEGAAMKLTGKLVGISPLDSARVKILINCGIGTDFGTGHKPLESGQD